MAPSPPIATISTPPQRRGQLIGILTMPTQLSQHLLTSPQTALKSQQTARIFAQATAVLSLCLAVIAGCEKEAGVSHYTAPKDQAPPSFALVAASTASSSTNTTTTTPTTTTGSTATGDHTGSSQAQNAALTWQPPSGWHQQAGNSSFRVATLSPQGGTEDIQIVVTFIPNDRSTAIANINRWRGQLGLPQVAEAQAMASTQDIQAGGPDGVLKGQLINIVGNDQRMIVAWFKMPEGGWYFKMQGDEEDVDNNETAMMQLTRSIRRAPPQAATNTGSNTASTQDPHAGHDHLPIPTLQERANIRDFEDLPSKEGLPTFEQAGIPGVEGKIKGIIPEGWTQTKPGQMLLASFDLPEINKQATEQIPAINLPGAKVTISRFPGNVGGREANIARWIRQLGVAADEVSVNSKWIRSDDVPIDVIEILPKQMMSLEARVSLNAVVRDAEGTWFIKLTGPVFSAAEQMNAYLLFLDQLELPYTLPLSETGWE